MRSLMGQRKAQKDRLEPKTCAMHFVLWLHHALMNDLSMYTNACSNTSHDKLKCFLDHMQIKKHYYRNEINSEQCREHCLSVVSDWNNKVIMEGFFSEQVQSKGFRYCSGICTKFELTAPFILLSITSPSLDEAKMQMELLVQKKPKIAQKMMSSFTFQNV